MFVPLRKTFLLFFLIENRPHPGATCDAKLSISLAALATESDIPGASRS